MPARHSHNSLDNSKTEVNVLIPELSVENFLASARLLNSFYDDFYCPNVNRCIFVYTTPFVFYVPATDLIKTLPLTQKRRIPTLTLRQQANEHLKYRFPNERKNWHARWFLWRHLDGVTSHTDHPPADHL